MGAREQKYNRKQLEDGKLLPSWIDTLLERGAKDIQQEHGLAVDGMVGPETQQLLSTLHHPTHPGPTVTGGLGYYPTGKGVYIRSLKQCGTPEEAVAVAKDAGLSFVAIGSVWVDRRAWAAGAVVARRMNSTADLIAYSAAFRSAGIEVWVWGYPYPGKEQAFVDTLMADALITEAVGVIIDPEKPYRGKGAQANTLIQMLRPELEDTHLALGVTSYGSAWYFKDFPWKTFAQIPGTFGSPQIYDGKNNLPANAAHRAFEAYLAAGFQEIVMSAPGYNKTTQQWNRLVGTYPTGTRGIIVWDWANLRLKKNKHLWQAIKHWVV